jgi:hypothetical protein
VCAGSAPRWLRRSSCWRRDNWVHLIPALRPRRPHPGADTATPSSDQSSPPSHLGPRRRAALVRSRRLSRKSSPSSHVFVHSPEADRAVGTHVPAGRATLRLTSRPEATATGGRRHDAEHLRSVFRPTRRRGRATLCCGALRAVREPWRVEHRAHRARGPHGCGPSASPKHNVARHRRRQQTSDQASPKQTTSPPPTPAAEDDHVTPERNSAGAVAQNTNGAQNEGTPRASREVPGFLCAVRYGAESVRSGDRGRRYQRHA